MNEHEAELKVAKDITLETILYSKYYWFSRLADRFHVVFGFDAGIDQQQFMIVKEIEQRLDNVQTIEYCLQFCYHDGKIILGGNFMQKVVDIIVTVFLLAAGVAFWPFGDSALCRITAVVSLLIFVGRVVKSLFGEGRKDESVGDAPAGMHRFLTKQSIWIKKCCEQTYAKSKMAVYLWGGGPMVALVIIGFLAQYPAQHVFTFHAPIGLLFGEVLTVITWPLLCAQGNWKKIIKSLQKNVMKLFPTDEAREGYFADYFDTDDHYTLVSKDSDDTTYTITVGKIYWSSIWQSGVINVVFAPQVEHIEIFKEVIVVRINRVRTYTTHYVAEIFDRNENPKKRPIARFSFGSRESLNAFLTLVSERTEKKIPVEDLGTKKI